MCLQNGSADVPTSKASVESMTKSEVISEGAVRKRVSGTSKKLKDALVHQVIQETEFPTGKVGWTIMTILSKRTVSHQIN